MWNDARSSLVTSSDFRLNLPDLTLSPCNTVDPKRWTAKIKCQIRSASCGRLLGEICRAPPSRSTSAAKNRERTKCTLQPTLNTFALVNQQPPSSWWLVPTRSTPSSCSHQSLGTWSCHGTSRENSRWTTEKNRSGNTDTHQPQKYVDGRRFMWQVL